jgi:hypothetical protein
MEEGFFFWAEDDECVGKGGIVFAKTKTTRRNAVAVEYYVNAFASHKDPPLARAVPPTAP